VLSCKTRYSPTWRRSPPLQMEFRERTQGCGQSRSAGFQPAVSPISNRQNVAMTVRGPIATPAAGSTGDTAGWKPALRTNWRSLSIALRANPRSRTPRGKKSGATFSRRNRKHTALRAKLHRSGRQVVEPVGEPEPSKGRNPPMAEAMRENCP